MTRHAWLQKHPTPAARGGEFHWYPPDGDRDLRAAFAERLAGAKAGDVLWQLAPDRIAWAHAFVVTAPLDGRRYTGLALAIADGASAAALLARLVPAAPAPWTDAPAPKPAAGPVVLPDPAAVARALIDGGCAPVGEPDRAGLPRAIAAIERVMPRAVTARVRHGRWLAGAGERKRDRVAELAVARDSRAWRLLCELATAERGVDELVAAIDREPADWLATLHAWGRGRLARDVDELADRVALRVLARLLADRDPSWAIAEARWHALLPASRRTELLAAVARRGPTLRALIHG